MTHRLILPALAAIGLALSACGPRTAVLQPAAPAPQPQTQAQVPSVFITAPGQRVRSVIAARAQSRGTTVAANTPQGVVLEREIPSSTEALEAQCGPHQAGRKIRVVLATQEAPGGTTVTEQRYILDGGGVCPVTLTSEEVTQANASLQDTRNQVLGVPPRPAAGTQPVAPATPRT
jgi:hypothetical protein